MSEEKSSVMNSALNLQEEQRDPLAANYGNAPLIQSQAVSGREWTKIAELDAGFQGNVVLIRGKLQNSRRVKKTMAFLVMRENGFTVQCVVGGLGSEQMVKYAASVTRESMVDVEGVVSVPPSTIKGSTQRVEIQVTKIHSVSTAKSPLPINIEDAARSEAQVRNGEAGVHQDQRLNNRVLDLHTPANQAIFELKDEIVFMFIQFLRSKRFRSIQTPKLQSGSSEGGSAVFNLQYMEGKPACLAQSPQLHKQMAVLGGFERVYEIGPVFRAENSSTHRHLCEFTGLDVEMEIKEHYFEVIQIVEELFMFMFESINKNCQKQLEAIGKQYPFEPIEYLPETLRLSYEEGMEMLKNAGVEVDPLGDLSTENERKLGELVKKEYHTDFFVLYHFPLAVRPFYTMPCPYNPAYSNSFDVFIRGEEIISGGQRIHACELLKKRAVEKGTDVSTISHYINSFEYGAPPHGGFGAGLERVVMLFCGLNNIRKTSLFPRDPNRLAP